MQHLSIKGQVLFMFYVCVLVKYPVYAYNEGVLKLEKPVIQRTPAICLYTKKEVGFL